MSNQCPLAITAALLLDFYKSGQFPMADSRNDQGFYMVDPPTRTVFTPETFHVPRSLAKFIRQMPEKQGWRTSIDQNFAGVIDLCRTPRTTRPDTWINQDIRDLFVELHLLGHAHSVEIWDKNNRLIGGLYGLAIGRVFCAESMASLESNASSVALVTLMKHLSAHGYELCDVQFTNPHLEQFHCTELSKHTYLTILNSGLNDPASF